MNRHLNILDFTLRSILGGFSSHLMVMSIFAAIVFFASSLIFTLQTLKIEAAEILSLAPEIIVQKMVAGRQIPIEKNNANVIESILGVRSAQPRVWGYLYEPYAGTNFTLWGLNGDTIGRMAAVNLKFREGGIFNPAQKGKIVVGEKIPEVLHLNGRRNMTLTDAMGRPRNFEISGIFTTSSSLLTADLMLMQETDLRDFFHLSREMATDIAVSVANPAEIAMVASKISRLLPDCRTVSRAQIERTYASVFNFRSAMALYVFSGCFGAFLILLWMRERLEVAEERTLIGILKVLGWSTTEILEMKMMEAMIIGFISFLIGFFVAYLHVSIFKAFLLRPLLFGWSVLYPTFDLMPVISLEGVALIFILTVIPYLATSLIPAWKNASRPDALVQGEGR